MDRPCGNLIVDRESTLADDIMTATAILERGSESVSAVMAGEDNRFTRALGALQTLAHAEGIPIAIVGGLGAIRYGYPAATQDIDVAVGVAHLASLVRAAPQYGFRVARESKTGWHTLTFGNVEINVVPQGARARDTAPTAIPSPEELGVSEGLGYASLAGWLELKLSAGRQKDRAHVVEILKTTPPDAIDAARARIASVHHEYATLFDQLYREALDEMGQEAGRD